MRSLSQRITSFLRREILSVFLPGFITLLGLSLFINRLDRRNSANPAEILSRLERELPSNTLVRLTLLLVLLLVLAYLTYAVGALSRKAIFHYMLDKRLGAGKGEPSAEHLQEMLNAWSTLVEAFGKKAVRTVFDVHGLTQALERRKGTLAEVRAQTAMQDSRVAAEPGLIVPRCSRAVSNTRMEFMYCKSWLSWHKSPGSTEHFEYEINVFCSLVIPFATISLLVGQFLFYSVLPGPWYLRLVIVGVGAGGLVFSQWKVMASIVQGLQRDENFDTIRNFFFHHWMAHLEPSPSRDDAQEARGAVVPSTPAPSPPP